MSGSGQFFVQSSGYRLPFTLGARQWFRGIPTPGAPPILAVGGISDCSNLASMSPPTIVEEFEIYGYSIGWGVNVENLGATEMTMQLELSLLINDRVAYSTTLADIAMSAGVPGQWFASGILRDDLFNPIRLGARERLGLQIGVSFDQTADTAGTAVKNVIVAANFEGTSQTAIGVESTISYNVLTLPASHRL